MGIHKFLIALDNATGDYYAGSTITGRILLWLNKPKKVRGIRIKIGGKAYVHWQHSEPVYNENRKRTQRNYRMVHYSAKEHYLNVHHYLQGSDHDTMILGAGYEHVYPFSIDLPLQLPASFEGKHGFIRYSVKATLVRPWMFDVKEKMPIKVVAPLDLNYHPSARVPVNKTEEKTFFKPFSSKNGPLTLSVSLPQSGFVIGQDIPITFKITNASNVPVDSIEIKLMKVERWTVYNPRHDTKSYKSEILKKILHGVDCIGSNTLTEMINLGYIPLINLEHCSIIDISFYLKVKVHVRSVCRKGLSTKIPLVIGNIPIHQQEVPYACSERISAFDNQQAWQDMYRTCGPTSNATAIHPNSIPTYNTEPPPYSVAISMATPSQSYVTTPQQYGSQFHANLQLTHSTLSLHPEVTPSIGHIKPTAPPSDQQ